MGHTAFEHGMGGGGAGGPGSAGFGAGFEDIFEDFFGDIFGGGSRQSGQRGPVRGADLRYNLTITLEEAYQGKTTKLKIPTQDTCQTCDGSGAKPGSNPTTCQTCGGAGQVRISQGFFNMTRTCPTCHGQGQIIKDKCTDCGGAGRVRTEKEIKVTIPKGVDDGNRIRLSGEGEAGPNGGPNGDLYIFVTVKEHNVFERDRQNLYLTVPLCITEAALGTEIEVPTPDGGKARLKVPEGTQNGQVFRLRNKGMPRVNQHTMGDLMVKVALEVPTKLSKKQKELLEELKDSFSSKNTPENESFLKKIQKYWKAA